MNRGVILGATYKKSARTLISTAGEIDLTRGMGGCLFPSRVYQRLDGLTTKLKQAQKRRVQLCDQVQKLERELGEVRIELGKAGQQVG